MMISLTGLGALGFISSIACLWSLRLAEEQDFSLTDFKVQINLPILTLQLLILVVASRSRERGIIAFTGFLLGLGFLLGVLNFDNSFGIYFAVLTFFHFSEFITTGLTNPHNLSFDSYLVNHSVQYSAAMLVSWVEHAATLYFFPQMKAYRPLTLCGLLVCMVGEILRKSAMFQAGRNFNHVVQDRRSKNHILVTSGIYSLFRHPSYVGWFLWSVGSQIILINPVCFLAYAYVTYQFFKERIYAEEYTLLAFFGDQYREYQSRVGTGLPGIHGYTHSHLHDD